MTKKSRIIIGSLLMLTTLSFAEYTPKKNKSFADDKYVLVFSDEFNLPNGSQPDSTKWSRCKRYNSEWNRWVSSSSDVVFIKKRHIDMSRNSKYKGEKRYCEDANRCYMDKK